MYLDENKIVYSLGPSRLGETCFADIVKEYGPFRLRRMVHRSPEGKISVSTRLGIFLKPDFAEQALEDIEWRWVRRQSFVKPAVEKLEREGVRGSYEESPSSRGDYQRFVS